MRPVCVFAKGPGEEIERLRADLRGRWRQASRAVMVLLSLQGLLAAQIAGLLECHPVTVRRWISRFNSGGMAGLADRPRCGRPPLGGKRLASRIAALLGRPGPWTLPRIWRYLGWPQVSMRTLPGQSRLVGGLAEQDHARVPDQAGSAASHLQGPVPLRILHDEGRSSPGKLHGVVTCNLPEPGRSSPLNLARTAAERPSWPFQHQIAAHS